MKHFRLLMALLLTLAAVSTLLPAQAASAAARSGPIADGCPIYQACMQFVGGGCSCTGFVCDGRFICGIPIT
jgi:hypothetical protein